MNFLEEQKQWERDHPEEARKRREAARRRDWLLYGALAIGYVVAALVAIFNQ